MTSPRGMSFPSSVLVPRATHPGERDRRGVPSPPRRPFLDG